MEVNVNKGFALLFEMGCGKTLTAIAIAGAAYKGGYIKKVLVIAPTSVVAVWPKELEEFADFPFTVQTLLGDKRKRLKAISDLERYRYPKLKAAVINYESVWRDDIFESLQKYDADMIICDESQRIKTHDSKQSKAIHKLGDQARYKLILSGTPVQNNAIDIWSQYRFLDASVFGDQFWAFKNHYCQMGGFNNKQIVRYRDLDGLIEKEHSIAFRITKEEAIDLPEQTFEVRNIEMSGKERKLYDALKRDSVAELESGGQVSATTVLTRLLRLQQLTGGFSCKGRCRQAGDGKHGEAGCDEGYHRGLRCGGREKAGGICPVHCRGGSHPGTGEENASKGQKGGQYIRGGQEGRSWGYREAVPDG